MDGKIIGLLEQVGRPYEMFNEDGTYQGCFYPVQFLYPDKPRYKLKHENIKDEFKFALQEIQNNCICINSSELKAGDIIVTFFRGILHVAIYIEHNKIIHVFKGNTLQIGRLKIFKDFQSYRVK